MKRAASTDPRLQRLERLAARHCLSVDQLVEIAERALAGPPPAKRGGGGSAKRSTGDAA